MLRKLCVLYSVVGMLCLAACGDHNIHKGDTTDAAGSVQPNNDLDSSTVKSVTSEETLIAEPRVFTINAQNLDTFYAEVKGYLNNASGYEVGILDNFKRTLLKGVEANTTYTLNSDTLKPAAESFVALLKQNMFVVVPNTTETVKVMYSVIENRPGSYLATEQEQALKATLDELQVKLYKHLLVALESSEGGELTLAALDQINIVYKIVSLKEQGLALGFDAHVSLKGVRDQVRNSKNAFDILSSKMQFVDMGGVQMRGISLGVLHPHDSKNLIYFLGLTVNNCFLELRNVTQPTQHTSENQYQLLLGYDFDNVTIGLKQISWDSNNFFNGAYCEVFLPIMPDFKLRFSGHVGVQFQTEGYADAYIGGAYNLLGAALDFGILLRNMRETSVQINTRYER